jgi:hypothetical protein
MLVERLAVRERAGSQAVDQRRGQRDVPAPHEALGHQEDRDPRAADGTDTASSVIHASATR